MTGMDLPPETVFYGSGVVCRGRHHGTNLMGATRVGRCSVGVQHRFISLEKFEVLTQVAEAARLEWRGFSSFTAPPTGSVVGINGADTVFIGRKLDKEGSMLPAVIEVPVFSYGTGIIKVSMEGKQLNVEDGDILVEIEPVRYQLKLEMLLKDPKTKKRNETLKKQNY